jgi:hypothetical protein
MLMQREADPRLVRLVRQLDAERQRAEKAEKQATALRGVITRMQRERLTTDAKPKQERVEC